LQHFVPAFSHLRAQPADLKAKVVALALKQEQVTAPLRKDDWFLCMNGMDQIQAALAAGAKPYEVPTPPGQIGKTMAIPDVPYVPKFLPPEKYQRVQERMRSQMQELLSRLVE